VDRVPVRRLSAAVAEVRPADGDVVGRGRDTIDGQSHAGGRRPRGRVVAGGGAGVRGPDEHGNALGGGLLPELLVEPVATGGQQELAGAVAGGQDRGQVVVDDVFGRQVEARSGIGRGGHHELDGGSGGQRARPFHVGGGLGLVGVGERAGVGAVDDDHRVPLGQAEQAAEAACIAHVDVAVGGNGDDLPAAAGPGAPEGARVGGAGGRAGADARG